MSKQSNMISHEQLQRIVRTIVLHDVSPQMCKQFHRKPVEVCRQVLDTLNLNVESTAYNRRDAEQLIYDEIMGC